MGPRPQGPNPLIFILVLLATLIINDARAAENVSFRPFETTRLKATGGTGVASILMDEASLLNPASVAFFNVSSLYLQKSGGEFKTESDVPHSQVGQASLGDKVNSMAVIASDGNQRISGSVSFVQQKEEQARRRQIGMATASSVGDHTSLGFAYLWQKDEIPGRPKTSRWRFNVGVLHAVSENLTAGLVVFEPWRKHRTLNMANFIVGLQYVYQSTISLMVDVGSNFYKNLNDFLLIKGAFQLKVLKDLFLRVGAFEDHGQRERGNGIGIGWAGPKLVFELAVKNTQLLPPANGTGATSGSGKTTLHESSFSMAYHF
jgi:hypothetical protein